MLDNSAQSTSGPFPINLEATFVRVRQHLDAIDPTRSNARVGFQGALSVSLALGALSLTTLWPEYVIWAGYWALMINLAILSGPGSFWHEGRITLAAILCHGVAIVAGSYAHIGTDWFFPTVGIAGFLSGLGIAFGATGGVIGATAFVSLALAATISGGAQFLAERAEASGIGIASTACVLLLIHVIGRRLKLADLGLPPPEPPVFHLFPSFERGVLLHAVRFMVTALAATFVASLIGVSHPLWVMLTIAVVLQRRLGETLMRGAQRLAGTLIGAVIGWAIAILVGPEHTVWLLVLIPFVLFGIYVYAPANYIVGIAFVTAFVLFVYALMGQPLTDSALERLFDTLVAGAIGIAISLVLVPESAVSGARAAVADFLDMASVQYRRALARRLGELSVDTAQTAADFEAKARLAAKEVAIAQWEAVPGRRVAGLRHDMRRLVASIYTHIDQFGDMTDPGAVNLGPKDRAVLLEEADGVESVFRELQTALKAGRAPKPSALSMARSLLAGAQEEPSAFKDSRLAIFGTLAAFLALQARRFPDQAPFKGASS